MDIIILGSGTCVPSLERQPCSVLIRHRGFVILVDAGPGILGQVLKAGLGIDDIDAVFLSHFHLDHCADLAPFLFATKYPEFTRSKPLLLAGGPGLSRWFDGLRQVFGHSIDLPDGYFECRELAAEGQIVLPGIAVAYAPMAHKPESLGYRFCDSTGFSLVYSGDTDVTDALVTLASGADILICEAATPDAMKAPGHLTPALAGELARKAGVGQLVLTHFYPACQGVDMAAQAGQNFSGEIIAAEDLMAL